MIDSRLNFSRASTVPSPSSPPVAFPCWDRKFRNQISDPWVKSSRWKLSHYLFHNFPKINLSADKSRRQFWLRGQNTMLERNVRFMNFNFCPHAKYSLASLGGVSIAALAYILFIARFGPRLPICIRIFWINKATILHFAANAGSITLINHSRKARSPVRKISLRDGLFG